MGNCIVLDKKNYIKIIKADGEVLKYKAPIKVHQLLSKFGGHAVYDAVPFVEHLHPDDDLIGGQKYHLLPLQELETSTAKSTAQLLNAVVTTGQAGGVVRIKLVISKQELKALLLKGGGIVDHMVPTLQKRKEVNEFDSFGADSKNHGGWKPALERIPE